MLYKQDAFHRRVEAVSSWFKVKGFHQIQDKQTEYYL